VRGLVEAGQPLTPAGITRLFQLQVFLLRYEFTLDPEESLEALLDRAVEDMVTYGALSRDGAGGLQVADRRLVGELAETVRNFHEGYLLVLLAARALRSRDIPREELPRRVQEWGQVRLAVDELRRPEALSMVGIKNAIRAFREEGVLQVRSGGGGLQFDERAWKQYTADLRMLLLIAEP
jgi:glycerol-3-phosphate O-acyltransferase